jgi:hypothetical protein
MKITLFKISLLSDIMLWLTHHQSEKELDRTRVIMGTRLWADFSVMTIEV